MQGKSFMSQIFAKRMAEKVTGEIDKSIGISHYQSINWSFFNSLKLNIKLHLPRICRCMCLKESSRDRMFKRGFDKFRNEIKITNILQTIRILKAHAKKDFSRIQWRIYKL